MATERLQIDLSYLGSNNVLIYPIYSEKGDLILEARTPLTLEKINEIIEKHGNIVYYSFSEEMDNIPNHRINTAIKQMKEVEEEILKTEKLSKTSYKNTENLIEMILNDLRSSDTGTIRLLKDLNTYDDYTYNHSVNVLLLVAVFSTKLHLFKVDELKSLLIGAYLHDIGKMKIDKQLLTKKGKLNVSEFQKMKRHPQLGYELIKNVAGNDRIVQQVVLFHHEKYNSKGYYSLPYEYLPVYPKIVSICDVFDALTTNRPYREAFSPSQAIKTIVNTVNQQFDFGLINNFVNTMSPLLNNTQSFYSRFDICELSTQELGLIMDYSFSDLMKPQVIVFCRFERNGGGFSARFYDKPVRLDLLKDDSKMMVRILTNKRQVNTLKDKLLERSLMQISQ